MSRLLNSQHILMMPGLRSQLAASRHPIVGPLSSAAPQLPSTSTDTSRQSNFTLSFKIYLFQSRSCRAICWHLKPTEVSRFPVVSCSLTCIFNTLLLYLAAVCTETTNHNSLFNHIMQMSAGLEVIYKRWLWLRGNTRRAWFFLPMVNPGQYFLQQGGEGMSICFLLLQQPCWKLRRAISLQIGT